MGVGEGVGAGDGDSVSWSSVPRFFPSLDLAMTIWAFSASCSRDFILRGGGVTASALHTREHLHPQMCVLDRPAY